MVNPSEALAKVFDKALQDARKLKHECITVEHLIFAMLCEENFESLIKEYGADPDLIKKNLEHYLKTKCEDLITEETKFKPKKTPTVERILNRAFTQVLFSGRTEIQVSDVFLSILHEKKSWATYYVEQAGITKDKFSDFLNTEIVSDDVEEMIDNRAATEALKSFTTNLNNEVKSNRISGYWSSRRT